MKSLEDKDKTLLVDASSFNEVDLDANFLTDK